MEKFTSEAVDVSIGWLKELNKMQRNNKPKNRSKLRALLPTILQPIINLLGTTTDSFLFVMSITPEQSAQQTWSSSISNWDVSTWLEEPEGAEVTSHLQLFYKTHAVKSPRQQQAGPNNTNTSDLYASEYRSLINVASQSMLPELGRYMVLTEHYEALGIEQKLAGGIFDINYPRSETRPSYIPESLPSHEDLAAWVTTPMSRYFFSTSNSSVEHARDSAENLLVWLSARPFTDPSYGLSLRGPGGVSFAVYILLRILITGRYLVDHPSIFDLPADSSKTVQRIRPIIRACASVLLSDLQVSIKMVEQTTSPRWDFNPYPRCSLQPPALNNRSAELGSQKATKKGIAPKRSRSQKETAVQPADDPKSQGTNENPPSGSGRTRIVPPWQRFFEAICEKSGKPLPDPLRAAIEKSKQTRLNDHERHGMDHITAKTRELGFATLGDPTRRTRYPHISNGKRLVSGEEYQRENKRVKEREEGAQDDGGISSDGQPKDYIIVLD